MYPTVIKIPLHPNYELPLQFQDDDVRYSNKLVEYFLAKYTKKGDKILDPFAGYGTTLYAAEAMDRIPYGIEYLKDRYEFIKSRLKNTDNIINGDTRKIDEYKLPQMDFCMTSPPYMSQDDQEFPFSAYTSTGTYSEYFKILSEIYLKIKVALKRDAYVILEVSNIKHDTVTTLAWDVGKELSKIFNFKGEIIIWWEDYPGDNGVYGTGYDHSYCLVFQNK